jgi:uridine kinase
MVHIIGISGQSGSGKTSFCRKVIEKLRQDNFSVCIITTDWFYKTTPSNSTQYNYDNPSAFDFQPLIDAIINGKRTKLPSYDYVHQCSIADVNTYDPDVDFLVLEGIMLYNDEMLRKLINTKIFVHTDLDACLARRILRDIKDRGRTVQSVINQWFETVKPGYEAFIYPTMKYADYIFNNTKDSIDQNIRQDTKFLTLFEKLKRSQSPPRDNKFREHLVSK